MQPNSTRAIKIVRDLPEAAWRRYVLAQPAGNIFHTPEMFQVFAATPGYQPELWAAVAAEEILALFLPVTVTLWGGPMRALTSRAISYGGVLCDEGAAGAAALTALLAAYRHAARGAVLFTELRHLGPTAALQPVLDAQGFVYEDHLDYLIDLARPPEAIFQSIGARTRKNLRRGLKRGEVTIAEVTDPAQIAPCYDLLAQTYQAAHVPLAARALFEAAFAGLFPHQMIRVTLARLQDAPVAVSVELLYKDVMYGWYGGMDRAYGSYVPNELLMWHILEWGAENGYRVYDFGGAGKPDEAYGVRDFKSKFGGQLVAWGRNACVHRPVWLQLSKWGYACYQRFL